MTADSTSSALRHTVNSGADPFEHLIPNDDFIDKALQKAKNWPLVPAIEDENGTLRVLVDQAQYLPRPRAPQVPAIVPQVSAPSRLDQLYAPHFVRLEQELQRRAAIPNDSIIDEVLQKAKNWSLVPAIEDENGTLLVLVDPKYLPRPHAPQVSTPSRLDQLYAPHFVRLERDLVAQSSHVPATVTEGRVAIPNDDFIDKALQKAKNWPLVPAIEDENGTLLVLVDPKYLRVPQVPAVVPQVSAPSRLDQLYAPHFVRLERDLVARSSHVPATVTEGRVATLGFTGVSAEGEPVFESTLEDHISAPAK